MSDETPAAKVIRLLGAKRLAYACDLTTSAVQKWNAGAGHIPAQHQGAVFRLAKVMGVELSAADIIGVAA